FKGLLGFASGTPYAPGGAAIVGENGPEIVNLPRGAQVVPARQTAAMAGGAVMHLNVTVNGARGNAEIRQMVAEGVGMGIDYFNSQVLPVRVNQIAQNPDIVGA
ncbi:MAG: hypothetical protein PF443_07860, partial [Allgaiera sp.]|nr:hypothetical protein [Allgaiera sp.]